MRMLLHRTISSLKVLPQRTVERCSRTFFTRGRVATISDWRDRRGESATTITLNFFSTLHNVSYEYLPLSASYKRKNGATVSNAQPSNLLLLEVPIDNIGEYGRLFMTLTGAGNAKVFHSGKVWEGRWSRGSVTDPFRITDATGNDILFTRGQIWVTVLPTFERVSWEVLP